MFKLLLLWFVVCTWMGFLGNKQVLGIELAKWRWTCKSNECHKVLQESEQPNSSQMSLAGCQSICGPHGAIWPQPKKATLGHVLTAISRPELNPNLGHLIINSPSRKVKAFVETSWSIFVSYFNESRYPNVHAIDSTPWKVQILVERSDLALNLRTDESYKLTVTSEDSNAFVSVSISSSTVFGARHALETLSQLISFDPDERKFQVVTPAVISDEPSFSYRGLLLDTGRNYFSIKSIKKMIDGLSYDKLNVFHWHMNEQQSFPFVSESVPELTKFGAYSKDQLYYPQDVQDVVRYAHQRGVIVLPEFDAPAHAAAGWTEIDKYSKKPTDSEMDLIVCNQKNWNNDFEQLSAEPPSGQLNPINPKVYEILGKVFHDFQKAFTTPDQPMPMFHMGGDEIFFTCWASNQGILEWMRKHDMPIEKQGYLELWSYFQNKTKVELEKVQPKYEDGLIMWTSELTRPEVIRKYVSKDDYIIQLWTTGTDRWISDLLQFGYRLIFSNYDAWYLDCGFGAWIYNGYGKENNWCSPFKGWKTIYSNSPRNIVVNQGILWNDTIKDLVQGGEATMWSEQVDELGVEPRIWPRISAVAERLWSDPTTDWKEAEHRILEHRERLVNRGIRADVIQPTFCRQNQGWCYMPLNRGAMYDPFLGSNYPSGDSFGNLQRESMNKIHLAEEIQKQLEQEQRKEWKDESKNQEAELSWSRESEFMSARNSFSKVHSSFSSFLVILSLFSITFVIYVNRRHLIPLIVRNFSFYRGRYKS